MKVLFAVSNENISQTIVKKYRTEYKQIISYKNVYYFNAILKELQRDKTYDRVVISEDLEQYVNADYEQMDKFLFDKLDSISDEASNISGEDIPMKFVLIVDAERQLVRLMSPLPFNMSEAKRLDGAIATCVATFGMADGNFDYDLATGEVMFRLTASFRNSVVGEGLFQYMISLSCAVVDKYNDQFLAIDKGVLDINDFIKNNS